MEYCILQFVSCSPTSLWCLRSAPLKRLQASARLHAVAFQKTAIFKKNVICKFVANAFGNNENFNWSRSQLSVLDTWLERFNGRYKVIFRGITVEKRITIQRRWQLREGNYMLYLLHIDGESKAIENVLKLVLRHGSWTHLTWICLYRTATHTLSSEGFSRKCCKSAPINFNVSVRQSGSSNVWNWPSRLSTTASAFSESESTSEHRLKTLNQSQMMGVALSSATREALVLTKGSLKAPTATEGTNIQQDSRGCPWKYFQVCDICEKCQM